MAQQHGQPLRPHPVTSPVSPDVSVFSYTRPLTSSSSGGYIPASVNPAPQFRQNSYAPNYPQAHVIQPNATQQRDTAFQKSQYPPAVNNHLNSQYPTGRTQPQDERSHGGSPFSRASGSNSSQCSPIAGTFETQQSPLPTQPSLQNLGYYIETSSQRRQSTQFSTASFPPAASSDNLPANPSKPDVTAQSRQHAANILLKTRVSLEQAYTEAHEELSRELVKAYNEINFWRGGSYKLQSRLQAAETELHVARSALQSIEHQRDTLYEDLNRRKTDADNRLAKFTCKFMEFRAKCDQEITSLRAGLAKSNVTNEALVAALEKVQNGETSAQLKISGHSSSDTDMTHPVEVDTAQNKVRQAMNAEFEAKFTRVLAQQQRERQKLEREIAALKAGKQSAVMNPDAGSSNLDATNEDSSLSSDTTSVARAASEQDVAPSDVSIKEEASSAALSGLEQELIDLTEVLDSPVLATHTLPESSLDTEEPQSDACATDVSGLLQKRTYESNTDKEQPPIKRRKTLDVIPPPENTYPLSTPTSVPLNLATKESTDDSHRENPDDTLVLSPARQEEPPVIPPAASLASHHPIPNGAVDEKVRVKEEQELEEFYSNAPHTPDPAVNTDGQSPAPANTPFNPPFSLQHIGLAYRTIDDKYECRMCLSRRVREPTVPVVSFPCKEASRDVLSAHYVEVHPVGYEGLITMSREEMVELAQRLVIEDLAPHGVHSKASKTK